FRQHREPRLQRRRGNAERAQPRNKTCHIARPDDAEFTQTVHNETDAESDAKNETRNLQKLRTRGEEEVGNTHAANFSGTNRSGKSRLCLCANDELFLT